MIFYLLVVALSWSGCIAENTDGDKVSIESIGNVEGIVTDTENIKLAGVLVTIGSTTATSNANGVYTLDDIEVGDRTITASLNGYETYTNTINVAKNTTITHNIQMTVPSSNPASEKLVWGSGMWGQNKFEKSN